MSKIPFAVTVSGTSHGEGIRTIIENVPADIKLDMAFIQAEMQRRKPGQKYTTPRPENDELEIRHGVDRGVTTGEALKLFVPNQNQRSASYDKLHNVLRPGHGITMQLLRDPNVDQAGGGAASARLTTGYVAAGAIAQCIMDQLHPDITTHAYISQMGSIKASIPETIDEAAIYKSPVRCPDKSASNHMERLMQELEKTGDSVGAVVQCQTSGYPGAIGERPGDSLDAELARAILTINAVKGVVIGDLEPYAKRGSEYNDQIKDFDGTNLYTYTNHGGGILGGLSVGGAPIVTSVLFKPTSSIKMPMKSVNLKHEPVIIELGEDDRHDPCVAIRGVEVVKAMQRLVLCRALLASQ